MRQQADAPGGMIECCEGGHSRVACAGDDREQERVSMPPKVREEGAENEVLVQGNILDRLGTKKFQSSI